MVKLHMTFWQTHLQFPQNCIFLVFLYYFPRLTTHSTAPTSLLCQSETASLRQIMAALLRISVSLIASASVNAVEGGYYGAAHVTHPAAHTRFTERGGAGITQVREHGAWKQQPLSSTISTAHPHGAVGTFTRADPGRGGILGS